jgi:hypothetical protein
MLTGTQPWDLITLGDREQLASELSVPMIANSPLAVLELLDRVVSMSWLLQCLLASLKKCLLFLICYTVLQLKSCMRFWERHKQLTLLQILCFWSIPISYSSLKDNVSETGFCFPLSVEPTQLDPIDRASPYLRTTASTQDGLCTPSTAQSICESYDKY